MKKILLIVLILGLFNGCLFHHPHHNSGYHSDRYDNHSYRNTSRHYDDRSYRQQSYDRRDNRSYRNHGDARMNVTRHGRER